MTIGITDRWGLRRVQSAVKSIQDVPARLDDLQLAIGEALRSAQESLKLATRGTVHQRLQAGIHNVPAGGNFLLLDNVIARLPVPFDGMTISFQVNPLVPRKVRLLPVGGPLEDSTTFQDIIVTDRVTLVASCGSWWFATKVWRAVLDIDFTTQGNVSITSDTNYVIGDYTFTAKNTAGMKGTFAVGSSGLQLGTSVGDAKAGFGARACPLLYFDLPTMRRSDPFFTMVEIVDIRSTSTSYDTFLGVGLDSPLSVRNLSAIGGVDTSTTETAFDRLYLYRMSSGSTVDSISVTGLAAEDQPNRVGLSLPSGVSVMSPAEIIAGVPARESGAFIGDEPVVGSLTCTEIRPSLTVSDAENMSICIGSSTSVAAASTRYAVVKSWKAQVFR